MDTKKNVPAVNKQQQDGEAEAVRNKFFTPKSHSGSTSNVI